MNDTQNTQHPNEPLLEAILVNQDKNSKSQESVLEAILVNQDSNAKSVEPILEASLVKQDEIVKELKKPLGLSIEINGASTTMYKGDKGEPGNIFDELTEEQKLSIKGDKGDKGEKGDQGDRGEQGLTGPKGDSIKGDKGERGRDGRNGNDGKNGLDGLDGIDGKDGKNGKDGKSIDPKDIKKIAKELNNNNNLFLNIPGVKHVHAGTNISITGTDEDPIINSTGGSGGGQVNTVVAGTGISVNSTDPVNPIITNSAPDQTVSITAGTNITSVTGTYPNFTINAATQTGGTGDVVGPASAINNNFAAFDTTTGKLIKDSGSNSSSFAPALGSDDNYVTDAEKVVIGNTSGTNTGDQTSIVGITGTFTQFNTAVTDAELARTDAANTFTGTQTITQIDMGNTDTSITRSAAGVISVEGVAIPSISSTSTLTNKRVQPRTASSTTSSNLSPDLSTANIYFRTTQTATLTIDAPTGTPVIGETIMIYVDSAGAQTLTINATYKVFGAAFPATTTAGKTFMMSAQYNGTDWKTLWANAV